MAKEVSHLPGKLKAILGEDFATASLHEVLRGLGISPARATGYMTARLATPGECELLRQDPPAALLVETRTVTDAKGEIIESTETAYVSSRWAMATSAAVLP